jgi:LacI family transcriptional regulator
MQQVLESGKSFTAVLASNDLSALGVMQALQDANLKIPDDVSVIGHDDILVLSNIKPHLTSLHVPKIDMGHAALDLLQARIQSPDRPIQHVLVAESLVARETVANVAGKKLQAINEKILPFRR